MRFEIYWLRDNLDRPSLEKVRRFFHLQELCCHPPAKTECALKSPVKNAAKGFSA